MGNGSAFKDGKVGTQYLSNESIVGIKIIQKVGKKEGDSDNTPMYSHTPNTMYAIRDKDTLKVDQVAVYEAIPGSKYGRKIKDIEWGHDHDPFKKGEVHVQDYIDGVRQKTPRVPTEEEKQIAEEIRSADGQG